MPSQRRQSRRASLRARALGHSHQTAFRHLVNVEPRSPVVPRPTPVQEALEHAVIGTVPWLRSDWEGTPDEMFAVEQISAHEDSLTLALRPGSSMAPLWRALPSWEQGHPVISNGEPGVRARSIDGGSGVEFFHVDRGGSIRVENCPAHALAEERAASDARGIIVPRGSLQPQERPAIRPPSPLPSIVVRRLGLLHELDAPSITVWWNIPGRRLSVEAYGARASDQAFEQVVGALGSREFSPRLDLVEPFDSSRYHTYLRVEGTEFELDLRVQR